VTKGAGSKAAALAMAYELLVTAQERWRRFNGHELITDVLDGATFNDGVKVRDDEPRRRTTRSPPEISHAVDPQLLTIAQLRELTRYRKSLIQERAREANRLHKTLENAGVKLSCVATDVLGVSGRLMLEALVSGTRDPELLANLARRALGKKLPALQEALAGDFKAHHRLIVSQILAHIDYLDEAISTLTQELEQRLAPLRTRRSCSARSMASPPARHR
jgi:hypothetical protein